MKTYRQTDASYDDAPIVSVLSAAKKLAAKQVILDYIDTGSKTYDEIEEYLLVTLGYANEFGATGNDVREVLDTMKATDETLEESGRPDGLFIESVSE
tara:strand:- start:442 stop:735 length:294 start_codon:yes stop_codon:yes gene_type:complete